MAEALGLVSSAIAVIEQSAKIGALCVQYLSAVSNAKEDVRRLATRVRGLETTVQHVQELLNQPDSQELLTSQKLLHSLGDCITELDELRRRLDPDKARKAMRRYGIRALSWPFTSKEIDQVVVHLERHESTIMLALQVDQTTLLLDIRQKMQGVSLHTVESPLPTRKPCIMLPFEPDPDFVDRPSIMAWMNDQHAASARRVALVGMGGIGKSQIAIQFAHHIRLIIPQTSIFWVHASNRARFEEAYQSIAEQLELPQRDNPKVNVLRLVCNWLQREDIDPWLMVLDNADDVDIFYSKPSTQTANSPYQPMEPQQVLASFLPKGSHGMILVTSRSTSAAEQLTGSHKQICRVLAMDDYEALRLFRNKLEGECDENLAPDLLRALDCIPLAITQAAAYINRRTPRMSVGTYLDGLGKNDKKRQSLLKNDAGDLRRDETGSNSVVATWQVTFEQIRKERPSAADLLAFSSFFNAQGIPEYALHGYKRDDSDRDGDGCNGTDDDSDDEFEEDLDVLRGYSLISTTSKDGFFEMHSLVQFCTQLWLSSVDQRARWRRVFLNTMSKHFPSGEYETWPTCQTLLPHIGSILNKEPDDEGLQDWANLLTNCSWYMLEMGNYKTAEILGKKAVEARERSLGERHPDTLTSMGHLSVVHLNQGRWTEAESLGTRVLEARKIAMGEEHPKTLISMSNLSSIYRRLGRWKEAEILEVRAMETSMKVLGEEHLDVLNSTLNLGVIYSKQGRYDKAKELKMRVMETRKKLLGEEHPETLSSILSLASTFWEQGLWTEAAELEVQVMETRKRLLGEEHPDTLESMANLATTLRDQGKWKDAEDLEVQVMQTSMRVLGEEHPDTLTSISNLASTYREMGQRKEAEKLNVEVISVLLREIGEEHPDTLTSMNNLMVVYMDECRWEEAEQLGLRLVASREKVQGPQHPDTLTSRSNLATTYGKRGRLKEAEELELQIVEMRMGLLGKEHPDTLTGMANLSSTYREQGRWNEAERLEVLILETSVRVLGNEHPDTLASIHNLAATVWELGRREEAEQLQVQAMETRERVLGSEHYDTLRSIAGLVSMYLVQDRWKEAEPLSERVAECRGRVLGPQHPDTLTSMSNLGSTYMCGGRWEEAVKIQVQVLETSERVLGKEHPHTLTSMGNLAFTYHQLGRLSEAIDLMQDCIGRREEVFGADCAKTRSLGETLAIWRDELTERGWERWLRRYESSGL